MCEKDRVDTFPVGMLVGALLMLCGVWAYYGTGLLP